MPPQDKQQESQATPFAEDVLDFFRQAVNEGGLSQATALQRNVGTGISDLISGGGNEFDLSELFASLQETFELDRTRGLQGVQEQFGAAGGRFGTPIAVGSARLLEGLIPRQESILGQLAFQGHEGAQNRLLGAFGAGTTAAAGQLLPFLQLASQGIINPQQRDNPIIGGIKAVGGAATDVAGLFG